MIVFSRTITRLWFSLGKSWPVPTSTHTGEVELVDRGLTGDAFPEHSNTTVYGSGTGRPICDFGSESGVTARPAPTASARSRRAGAGSETVMSHTLRVQDRGDQQADGPGAGHQHAVVGRDLRQRDRVERNRGRLGEGRGPRRQVVGHGHQPIHGRHHVPGEGAAERQVVGRRSLQTHRRPVGATGPALAAPRLRSAHHPPADLPVVDPAAEGDDGARPLVAQGAAGTCDPLEHEVQVGAADPALRDLDAHLTGPGLGHRHVVHLQRAVTDVDAGRHQLHRSVPPVAHSIGPPGHYPRPRWCCARSK